MSRFASIYWPIWLGSTVATFLWYEILSLITRNPRNTLSDWIWVHLHIRAGESIGQWNAADLLTFCVYLSVFVLWLPYHFWFHRFT